MSWSSATAVTTKLEPSMAAVNRLGSRVYAVHPTALYSAHNLSSEMLVVVSMRYAVAVSGCVSECMSGTFTVACERTPNPFELYEVKLTIL